MEFEIVKSTHNGGREHNEDSCAFIRTNTGILLVLADGMGGHQGGEFASQYFCEAIIESASMLSSSPLPETADNMVQMISAAAQAMALRLATNHPGLDAHTTCVMAWLSDQQTLCAHVGDSRCYLLNRERVVWHTRDHSVAQLLVSQGEITQDEAATHPDQSKLYRSIGISGKPKPTFKHLQPLAADDALLLCSDGLWTSITDDELITLAIDQDPQQAIDTIVSTAVKRGGAEGDNVTALMVRNV